MKCYNWISIRSQIKCHTFFMLYVKSLIKKIDGLANNPENSSATKLREHILCEHSISAIWGFEHIEDKHTL